MFPWVLSNKWSLPPSEPCIHYNQVSHSSWPYTIFFKVPRGNLLDTVILFSGFFCCLICHLHIVTLPLGLYLHCPHSICIIRDSLLQTNWIQLAAIALFCFFVCLFFILCISSSSSRKPISFSFQVGKKLSALSEMLFQFRGQSESTCFSKGTEERSCHFSCYYHWVWNKQTNNRALHFFAIVIISTSIASFRKSPPNSI